MYVFRCVASDYYDYSGKCIGVNWHAPLDNQLYVFQLI